MDHWRNYVGGTASPLSKLSKWTTKEFSFKLLNTFRDNVEIG